MPDRLQRQPEWARVEQVGEPAVCRYDVRLPSMVYPIRIIRLAKYAH